MKVRISLMMLKQTKEISTAKGKNLDHNTYNSSINTLTLNVDDEIIDLALVNKASFLSNDLWHDEKAGSSSASDRNSCVSYTKGQKIGKLLKQKVGKGEKSKYLNKKSPNKMSAIE